MHRLLSRIALCTVCATLSNVSYASERTKTPPQAGTAQYLQWIRDADALVNQKKFGDAVALYEKAVQVNPVNGEGWMSLANALLSVGEFQKAIPNFEKAWQLGTSFRFIPPYNIACCYARMGDKERAFQWLQKALDTGFRSLDQIPKDDDLKSLHGDPRFTKITATADTSRMTRTEGWRYDLWLLHRELTRIHINPYRITPKKQMDTFVSKLNREIPYITDSQISVRMMALARMLGDAHTVVRPPVLLGADAKSVPLQVSFFTEGLYIIASAPEQASLIGAEILKIGGHTVDEVMKALDPIISRDNTLWLKRIAPSLIVTPFILNGVGLTPNPQETTYTLRDAQGKEQEITLKAQSFASKESWGVCFDKEHPPLYLKQNASPNWFEYLPDQKILYCHYGAVQDQPDLSVAQFFEKVFQYAEKNDVERFVLDMRTNGGGNLFLNQPLIHGLIQHEKINQPGKLFVIIGRATFSAAVSCVGKIDANTNALFVGEPTGSPPNFIGESIPVRLPYSKIRGSISDLYWQNTFAMDYRTWVAPSLYAPPSFALLKAGHDPAMEVISEYLQANQH